uniref:SCAN domain-containing protein 3-like isoform X1 n=1 Tax=Pogona vitticeps TaxID=103695 RepID=A0ABM5F7I7_9SAUR
MATSTSSNLSARRASFLVASRIAKAKMPFAVGEELILPAVKAVCRELLGEAAAQKVAHVSLSPSTIPGGIDEIAEDIEAQLLERIKASPWYALQVDESISVENMAIMLVFVRYIFQEDVHTDMLCACLLPTNATAAERFKSLNDYMSGKLNWSFCVGICTDGAAAGWISGFTTRVKEVASECHKQHHLRFCKLHRQMYGACTPLFSCPCCSRLKKQIATTCPVKTGDGENRCVVSSLMLIGLALKWYEHFSLGISFEMISVGGSLSVLSAHALLHSSLPLALSLPPFYWPVGLWAWKIRSLNPDVQRREAVMLVWWTGTATHLLGILLFLLSIFKEK